MRLHNRKYLIIICILSFTVTSCPNFSKNYKEGLQKEVRGEFPVYGNWCGRGHPKLGENPEPVDELDRACNRHDLCYGRENKDFSCECDVQLIRDIEHIKFPGKTDSVGEVVNARLVLGYFQLSPCKGVKDMATKALKLIEKSVGVASPDHWGLLNPVVWIVSSIYIGILYLINDILGPLFTDEPDQSNQTSQNITT